MLLRIKKIKGNSPCQLFSVEKALAVHVRRLILSCLTVFVQHKYDSKTTQTEPGISYVSSLSKSIVKKMYTFDIATMAI